MEGNQVKLFPHLLPKEVEIWDRFLDRYPGYCDYYEYDIHVGEGIDVSDRYPKAYVDMVRKLTQKRIDVVGFRNDLVFLFEVKPDAGLTALGELLAYMFYFSRKYKYDGVIRSVLVTDIIDPDTVDVLLAKGILVFVV